MKLPHVEITLYPSTTKIIGGVIVRGKAEGESMIKGMKKARMWRWKSAVQGLKEGLEVITKSKRRSSKRVRPPTTPALAWAKKAFNYTPVPGPEYLNNFEAELLRVFMENTDLTQSPLSLREIVKPLKNMEFIDLWLILNTRSNIEIEPFRFMKIGKERIYVYTRYHWCRFFLWIVEREPIRIVLDPIWSSPSVVSRQVVYTDDPLAGGFSESYWMTFANFVNLPDEEYVRAFHDAVVERINQSPRAWIRKFGMYMMRKINYDNITRGRKVVSLEDISLKDIPLRKVLGPWYEKYVIKYRSKYDIFQEILLAFIVEKRKPRIRYAPVWFNRYLDPSLTHY